MITYKGCDLKLDKRKFQSSFFDLRLLARGLKYRKLEVLY